MNIGLFDAEGKPVANPPTSVPLLQDDDKPPTFSGWCEWMPYQQQKAVKEDPTKPPAKGRGKAVKAGLVLLALLGLAGVAAAADPAQRAAASLGVPCPYEARAAAAFDAQRPAPPAIPLAVDLADCDCHETGDCKCDPATCKCCEGGCPSYSEQYAKAIHGPDGTIVVCYWGCRGKCINGALCGECHVDPHGKSLPGITPAVYIGVSRGGTLPQTAVLPATATHDQIAAAVTAAKIATAPPATSPPACTTCTGTSCTSCQQQAGWSRFWR